MEMAETPMETAETPTETAETPMETAEIPMETAETPMETAETTVTHRNPSPAAVISSTVRTAHVCKSLTVQSKNLKKDADAHVESQIGLRQIGEMK